MKITTVGIDLAKNVFQVHGVDEHGKAVLRKQLRRDQVDGLLRQPSAVLDRHGGMRQRASLGAQAAGARPHVRLMAPQFVKPYVKTNKNDAADAEAICEAVARPNMRFVPVKNIEQQAVLALHRVRQGFVKARTAQANQIRGLLGEFGLIMPQGIGYIAKRVPTLLEDASNRAARLVPTTDRSPDRASEGAGPLSRGVRSADQGVASQQRAQPSWRSPRYRPTDGQRAGRHRRRCEELRQWPAVRGLARAGPTAALERRQADAAWHEQTRRCLPAHAADPRRPIGDPGGAAQGREHATSG